MTKIAIAALIFACAASGLAQKLDVRILDRKDNETEYTYFVPGHFSSQSHSDANCNVGDSDVTCNVSTTTNGYITPAHQMSYHVRGATLSLQLPDGRIAVVNCENKFVRWTMANGLAGNHRGCRQPLVDNIQADFHGDKAKLEWVISLDGKRKQSETYAVLAILDKAKGDQH